MPGGEHTLQPLLSVARYYLVAEGGVAQGWRLPLLLHIRQGRVWGFCRKSSIRPLFSETRAEGLWGLGFGWSEIIWMDGKAVENWTEIGR